MYHSVNEEFLEKQRVKEGKAGLVRTPGQEAERFEEEEELRMVHLDEQYNEGVFDKAAIKEI